MWSKVAVGILCLVPGIAEPCPDGSYRSSEIIFSCGGGYGRHNLSLAPAATSAPMAIPLGAEGFRVSASSSSGPLSLQLRDDANNVLVAAQDHGLVNRTVRAGVYKDVGIIMSKSAVFPEDNVSLYLLGALTSPMELSFCNLAENSSARVTIAYTFERVLECSFPPAGCSKYNKAAARWQVEVWSHWVSSHYDNASEAWTALAQPYARANGVPWSAWPQVWSSFIGNSSAVVGEEWQPGFAYLDSSMDGHVSQDEFADGFALSSSKARAQDDTEGPNMVGEVTEVVESNQWMFSYALVALGVLLLICCLWSCRPKRDGVARSISQLSRPDVEAGKQRAGAHGPITKKPDPMLKAGHVNGNVKENFSDGKAAAPPNGLWLFPQIGQAGLPQLHQESFRYSPLPMQEEQHPMMPGGSFSMQAVPRSASHESFTGPTGTWSSNTSQIPQLGSFSLPVGNGMAGSPTHLGMPLRQDPWMDPMWQSRPLNLQTPSLFQVELPRADPLRADGSIFHQASLSAPPMQVAQPPVQTEQAGVVQAELAGPVQVELPASTKVGEDGWDRIADAVVAPALMNPLRAELTR